MKSQQDMAPDPTRPPLATSLTSLACLLSWGAGGERDPERQDHDGDEMELQAAFEAAEAEPGASGRTLVGRGRTSEPAGKSAKLDGGRSKLAKRADAPIVRTKARVSLERALDSGLPENREDTLPTTR